MLVFAGLKSPWVVLRIIESKGPRCGLEHSFDFPRCWTPIRVRVMFVEAFFPRHDRQYDLPHHHPISKHNRGEGKREEEKEGKRTSSQLPCAVTGCVHVGIAFDKSPSPGIGYSAIDRLDIESLPPRA